jgi:hypothetical protein
VKATFAASIFFAKAAQFRLTFVDLSGPLARTAPRSWFLAILRGVIRGKAPSASHGRSAFQRPVTIFSAQRRRSGPVRFALEGKGERLKAAEVVVREMNGDAPPAE